MLYRRAQLDDYTKIVELQNINLIPRGVLATAFTACHFQQMNEILSVVVAEEDGKIVGYLGACTIDFYQQFPIAAAMIQHLNNTYDKAIDMSATFIGNPVCIHADYRGQGIYAGLCSKILEFIPADFKFVLTMIASENKTSLKAARRLGFNMVDQYLANNLLFYTMLASISMLKNCE